MENFKITKEQVLKIYDATSVNNQEELEQWFPEAFKKELEVGKWYVVTNIAHGSLGFTGIGQYTLDSSTAGLLNSQSGYNFKQANGTIWRTNGYINKATEKEVENVLIEQAKMRYGNGVDIQSLAFNNDIDKLGVSFQYYHDGNCLWSNGIKIFNNGKWAKIIETITKEEAEKLLNKKII